VDNRLSSITFDFEENHRVRVVMINGEPWWVAKDVCDALGLTDARKSVNLLDDDERNTIPVTDTLGREQDTFVISEPGLYSLVLRSRRPEAKLFKRWVVHEVLPQIRQTGTYVSDPKLPTNFLEALEALLESEREKQRMSDRVQALTPKAEAYDVLLSGNNAQTMAQVAKSLGTGRNRLFALLRRNRILMMNNLPYQEYLERGYFKVREVPTTQGNRVVNVTQTLVTSKGLDYVRQLLNNEELRMTNLANLRVQ
jgi:anti-repressor protein